MPAGGLVTAGVGAAIGLGTAIYGGIKKRQAERAAAANVMPTYNIPTEDKDALTLAGSQAGQGMSDASRQAYLNNAGSRLAATTNAILRGGGDANSIGNAYNKYETGINNQAIYDDQARMNHLSNLQGEFHRMSAQKDKQWQINQYAPWANKAQAIGQQLTGSQNMINSGISTMSGAATTAASGYFGAVKKLQPTGGQGTAPSWLTQNMQAGNVPQQQPAFGGQWHAPMDGDQPGAFKFPSYYGLDYQGQ